MGCYVRIWYLVGLVDLEMELTGEQCFVMIWPVIAVRFGDKGARTGRRIIVSISMRGL